jgi:hypothetical protein
MAFRPLATSKFIKLGKPRVVPGGRGEEYLELEQGFRNFQVP